MFPESPGCLSMRCHRQGSQQTPRLSRLPSTSCRFPSLRHTCPTHTCHETSRPIQTSRLPRISFPTMFTSYLTSENTATSLHASCVGERVAQSHPNMEVTRILLTFFLDLQSPWTSNPPRFLSHVFPHVWATCRHSNQAPTWWRTSPFWPLSPERRYYAETVFHTCHETSRAIQSSRLVPVTFRTMST